MKYKTLFRVLLKLVGVWMFAQGVASLASSLPAYWWINQTGVGTRWFFAISPVVISSVMNTLIGLYLFFGGEWIVNHAIPSNRPYCHDCGYDLSNASDRTCAECGTPIPPPPETRDPLS